MTFPTVPTTGNTRILSQNQNDTTATRTFPTLSSLTKNSGDLLVAIVVAYERTAAGATFSGWTGGFAEVADVDGGATTMAVGVATKTSTGSETGTFAVTQATTVVGHCSLFVMSIAGWHGTTAPELTALAVGTAAAADPGALAPSWGAADTLWVAVGGNGETNTGGSWTGMGANTPPTSYTDGNSPGLGTDAVGGIESTVAFRQNNTASEDVATWTTHDLNNARNCALLIAIRPAVDPNATVTPPVVAVVATVPAVTVTAVTTVSPATVAAVATIPAVGVLDPGDWGADATTWGSTTRTWSGAEVTGGATVTPPVVASVATVPAVTVSTGSTVAAVAVASVATVPAVTVNTGSTVSPPVVAAVATIPAVTLSTGSTVTATVVAAAAAIPAPTVTTEGETLPPILVMARRAW